MMPFVKTNELNWTRIWAEAAGSRGDEHRGRRHVILAAMVEFRCQVLPPLQLSLGSGGGGWRQG